MLEYILLGVYIDLLKFYINLHVQLQNRVEARGMDPLEIRWLKDTLVLQVLTILEGPISSRRLLSMYMKKSLFIFRGN